MPLSEDVDMQKSPWLHLSGTALVDCWIIPKEFPYLRSPTCHSCTSSWWALPVQLLDTKHGHIPQWHHCCANGTYRPLLSQKKTLVLMCGGNKVIADDFLKIQIWYMLLMLTCESRTHSLCCCDCPWTVAATCLEIPLKAYLLTIIFWMESNYAITDAQWGIYFHENVQEAASKFCIKNRTYRSLCNWEMLALK